LGAGIAEEPVHWFGGVVDHWGEDVPVDATGHACAFMAGSMSAIGSRSTPAANKSETTGFSQSP